MLLIKLVVDKFFDIFDILMLVFNAGVLIVGSCVVVYGDIVWLFQADDTTILLYGFDILLFGMLVDALIIAICFAAIKLIDWFQGKASSS